MARTSNAGGKRPGAGQPTGNRYQRKLGAPPAALQAPETAAVITADLTPSAPLAPWLQAAIDFYVQGYTWAAIGRLVHKDREWIKGKILEQPLAIDSARQHFTTPADPRAAMAPYLPDALRTIGDLIGPDSEAKPETRLSAVRDVVLAYAWDKPKIVSESTNRTMLLVQVIDATESD